MFYNFFIFLLCIPTVIYSSSPAAISQKWSQIDRDLSALEKEDTASWISSRTAIVDQINNLIRQGFDNKAIALFQRIHKRDDQILQQALPAIKSDTEWQQLKRDKKSLKTITERQSLTIKNLESEHKKKIDALNESEKQLKQAQETIASLTQEVDRLKKENEIQSKKLQ